MNCKLNRSFFWYYWYFSFSSLLTFFTFSYSKLYARLGSCRQIFLVTILMYSLELSSQNKQNLNESTTLEGYLDVKKLVTWPAIIEPSSNQKSNAREFQYMSILLALAYHDRATYETFTINRWILSSLLFRLDLQQDRHTVLVQCLNRWLTWTGTKRFRQTKYHPTKTRPSEFVAEKWTNLKF